LGGVALAALAALSLFPLTRSIRSDLGAAVLEQLRQNEDRAESVADGRPKADSSDQ